jgi:hypothetical protein
MRTYATVVLLIILVPSEYRAQITRAYISQNEITIGERVTLSYSLPVKFTDPLLFNPSKKFIPSKRSNSEGKIEDAPLETVEIVVPFRDTITDTEGGPVWTGYYEITVWDSGTFALPGPEIKIGKQQLQFPSVRFSGRLAPAIKGLDTYDIKESFAELPPQTMREKLTSILSYYWWVIVLFFATLLVWIWYKRKKTDRLEDHKTITIYEKALNDLRDLERKELWNFGKIKTHYSELSLILRSYLSSIFQLQLLERTTVETLLFISQKIESKEQHNSLKQLLESSDLVKFAKYHPDDNEVLAHLRQSKELITAIHENTSPTDEQ